MKSGEFIAIYGAPNLGKTRQTGILVDELNNLGIKTQYLKYPIYDSRTGIEINKILRNSQKASSVELQELFAENRRDFEPDLVERLERGEWIIAEDYNKTGNAHGVAKGIPIEKMEEINRGQLEENLGILIDGEYRYAEAVEVGHIYEEETHWLKVRDIYREFIERYNWKVVNGNQGVEQVHADIMKFVNPLIEEFQKKR